MSIYCANVHDSSIFAISPPTFNEGLRRMINENSTLKNEIFCEVNAVM